MRPHFSFEAALALLAAEAHGNRGIAVRGVLALRVPTALHASGGVGA
eukprot:CAMPEP_0117505352 /NCGR_PEP_ID=MMETSP0784-20121206/25332_1 /TAXON_ID=39447 /ORGANISM="" /LENGTH=46 /DNA_ID= /DNA_START= /DNA_END= /DNA_ORIENTATION=